VECAETSVTRGRPGAIARWSPLTPSPGRSPPRCGRRDYAEGAAGCQGGPAPPQLVSPAARAPRAPGRQTRDGNFGNFLVALTCKAEDLVGDMQLALDAAPYYDAAPYPWRAAGAEATPPGGPAPARAADGPVRAPPAPALRRALASRKPSPAYPNEPAGRPASRSRLLRKPAAAAGICCGGAGRVTDRKGTLSWELSVLALPAARPEYHPESPPAQHRAPGGGILTQSV
jgi:hypothetical protein